MNSEHQIIFYSGPEGETRVEVFFLEESLWLSQKRMAELFGVEVPTINYHLKEIFKSGELVEEPVIRNFRITAAAKTSFGNSIVSSTCTLISPSFRLNVKFQ